MNSTATMADDKARLRRLRSLHLLDPVAEELLDGFTQLAARSTGLPIAVLTLVDGERHWIKSAVGLPAGMRLPHLLPAGCVLCEHAIAETWGLFEVEDAAADPRFAADPVLSGSMRVVHYAAAPLVMPDGEVIGTLGVAEPDAGRLQRAQRDLLQDLAAQVVRVLHLREQERRLAQERLLTEAVDLAELAPVGIFAMDAAGEVIYANRRWATLLGRSSVEAVSGGGWITSVHPDDRNSLLEARRAGQADRRAYMHLFRTRPDAAGTVRWIRARVTPVEARLAPVTFVGAAVDVTPMRELSGELENKNRLLQSIIQHLPCGVMVLDDQLRPVLSNEAARRALTDDQGIFEGEADAVQLAHRLVPGALVQLQDPEPAATASGAGGQHVVEIRNARLPAGGVITTFTDVTDARRAAEQLETSQARLQRALDASGLGLWEFDLRAATVYLAAGCARLLGLPERDTEVTPEQMLALVPRHEGRRIATCRRRLLRGEVPHLSLEFQLRRQDHPAPGWLLVVARVAERDADGRPVRVVGTCQDISRRMQKAAELRAALHAADEANRAKSEFLATMSHEIRTPLNGVIGLAKLLSSARLPPMELQSVAMLQGCAKSLLSVVDNILDFSRIEAGALALEEVPVNLSALVQELSDLFTVRAAEKGIRFDLLVQPGLPPWILSDPTRLRQILLNLLSNALKFTSHGHFSLAAEVLEAQAGSRLRFVVRDTGIGIPEEQQRRLFNRFTQVDSTTTRKFGGTGLGLAISRQLAELMGGEVTLASAPGAGSTFTLDIPLRSATAPALARTCASRSEAVRTDAQILLAEDNEVNQHVARRLLELLGYGNVTVVRDGQEAVDACMRRSFDLVLMDCQMPVLDGRAATRALRAAGLRLPVLALTATATATDREECLGAGMNDYLSKPIELSVLGGKMQRWLGDERHEEREVGSALRERVPPPHTPPFDPQAIARHFLGDTAFFSQARQVFLRTARDGLQQLEAALQGGDNRRASELAHRLRGSAATLGADLLAHCCSQLESGLVDPHQPQAWVTRARSAFEAFAERSAPAAQAKG